MGKHPFPNATMTNPPSFFDPALVREVYRVPYQERTTQAKAWATEHQIAPAHSDTQRIALLLIDVQNTFCLPDFELFVGALWPGRGGR